MRVRSWAVVLGLAAVAGCSSNELRGGSNVGGKASGDNGDPNLGGSAMSGRGNAESGRAGSASVGGNTGSSVDGGGASAGTNVERGGRAGGDAAGRGDATGGAAGRGGAAASSGAGGEGDAGQGGVSSGAGGEGDAGQGGVSSGGMAGQSGSGNMGATGGTGTPRCSAGSEGPEGRSCAGLTTGCGRPSSESCCKSLCAPGGSFTFGGTVATPTVQASVSSFFLDAYEVTVARFRAFVNDYDVWHVTGANPKPGDGSAPMSGSGWNSGWSSLLPANAAALRSAVKCSPYQTWTDTIGTAGERREEVPMNCVTWYEAFAFCVWDGGRLPTEAEWEFAASGGDPRLYPWGSSAPTPDHAVFGCLGDGSALDCTLQDILAVGSKPNGAGAFGHRDLAGSIYEWVFDRHDRSASFPATCNDCANTSNGPYRARRGGDWMYDASLLRAADRSDGGVPTNRDHGMGARCVRAASASAGLAEAKAFR